MEDTVKFDGREFKVTAGADVETVKRLIGETYPAIEKAECSIAENSDGTRTLNFVVKAGAKG